MAGAVIGALRVVLGLDSATFTSGLNSAQKEMKAAGKQLQSIGDGMSRVGGTLSVAVTAPLIAAGFAASKAATESRDAMGQVEAALKSMGSAAGQTKESLAGMATDIMRNSLYDDDDILRKVTANLLTFGKIAGDEFRRAQIAAADLATRMGGDLQAATILVGKALNDPVRGMGALRKAGVQLDESQQKLVKTMVAGGNVAGAQRILLRELESQFGGSARAAQDTDPYDSLRDSLNDLSESMGGLINDFIAPMIQKVSVLAASFTTLSPEVQKFALMGAVVAAALGPALVVIGQVVGAIGGLAIAFAEGGVLAGLGGFVLAAAPFVAAAAAIAAAVWLFRDDLAPIFDEFKQAVMDAVGPYLPGILAGAQQAFAALGPAISAVVGFVGPILAALTKAFVAAFGPILITMFKVMAAQISGAMQIVTNVLRFVTALLTGDWRGAWNAAGSVVGSILNTIGRTIDAVFPGALGMITRMVEGVKRILTVDLFGVFKTAVGKVKEVGDAFFNLYDRVVGHSYVPDMVEGVAAWMAKLDGGMLVPAKSMTEKTADAFEAMRDRVAAVFDTLLTDREKLTRGLAAQMKTLDDALAAGPTRGGITREQYDAAKAGVNRNARIESAGIDAEGMEAAKVPTLTEGFSEVDRLQAKWKDIQEQIKGSREDFADAFAGGMDAALHGDWRGVLQSIFGDSMNKALKGIGSSIFDMLGGGKGGSVGGGIGSMISGLFNKLPKFANGGTIGAGGSGGIDSQLVSFWKSPSEQVDVYKPGSDKGGLGNITYAPVIDARGASAEAVSRLEAIMERQQRDFAKNVRATVNRDMATGRVGTPNWA